MKEFVFTSKILINQLFNNRSTHKIVICFIIVYSLLISFLGLKDFFELFYGLKILFTFIFITPVLCLTFKEDYIKKSYQAVKEKLPIGNKTFLLSHIFINLVFILIIIFPALVSDYYCIHKYYQVPYLYYAFECFKNLILILFYLTISFGYRISRFYYYDFSTFLPFFGTLFWGFFPGIISMFFQTFNDVIKLIPYRLSSLGLFFYDGTIFSMPKMGIIPNDVLLVIIMTIISWLMYRYVIINNMGNYSKIIE